MIKKLKKIHFNYGSATVGRGKYWVRRAFSTVQLLTLYLVFMKQLKQEKFNRRN